MVEIEKKLNVLERLTAMTILPKEGSFVTLRLIRGLSEKLGLSADELLEFGIEQKDNKVNWNEKGNEEKPIQFKEKECELLKDALIKLDKEKKLEQRQFSLYEKFVEFDENA